MKDGRDVSKLVREASFCIMGISHIISHIHRGFLLVYSMEVVLPVEIEVGSLRIALGYQIAKMDWLQAKYDQLNLLDEKRLRATYHMHAY